MMNELAHHYHSVVSTVVFRGIESDFEFLFHSLMKFLLANRIATDGTLRSVPFCLHMSKKYDIFYNSLTFITAYLVCS